MAGQCDSKHSNITTSSIDLMWSAVPAMENLTHYVIFRDDVEIGRVGLPVNTFSAQNLSPNTTSTFRVELLGPTDRLSVGGPTAQATTLDLDAPVWPDDTALQASQITETGTTLTWTALIPEASVKQYDIYQDDVLVGTTQPPWHVYCQ